MISTGPASTELPYQGHTNLLVGTAEQITDRLDDLKRLKEEILPKVDAS